MTVVIGTPLNRVDGCLKVTGSAKYTAELHVDNLAYAVLVKSTVPLGRITRLDMSSAEAAPGVLVVITHLNAPRLNTPTSFGFGHSLMPLQGDAVHYAGQDIAVVVADTLERAEHAATLVRVEYETAPHVARPDDALSSMFPVPITNPPADSNRGDVAHGMEMADARVEADYSSVILNHNPIEPHATIAWWEGERLEMLDATQAVFLVRSTLAEVLGIPADNIHVVNQFLGGGFGSKTFGWPHEILTAVAARHVGRPVKLVLSRKQMFTSAQRVACDTRTSIGMLGL